MKRVAWMVVVMFSGLLTGFARESMEWCSINSYDATSTNLPRVLLIGDSIASRYAGTVRTALNGKAYLSQMTTSKAVGDPALLDEVGTILRQYKYAVIHFNIGLHGFNPVAYRKAFPELIAALRRDAPGAKLIWATTTPCRGEGGVAANVRKCNEIAAEFTAKEKIPVDDLFGLVMSHTNNPAVLWDGGGVHFTEEGAALQGKQVAGSVLKLLGE
jgi:hypothetical protein